MQQDSPSDNKLKPVDDGEPMEIDADEASTPKGFARRSCQRQVYDVAKWRNTIAVMDTGAGKTLIAIMLIKEMGQAIKSSVDKKIILFLAPTVSLVNQQYEAIKTHTDLRVKQIYGEMGVDEWSAQCWEKEMNDHQVLVMTPQITLDALRNAFMTMKTVCLMVFDECHCAIGNHSYARIMKEFYHKSNYKPKIFGMTTSLVIRKGVSSGMDCEDQLFDLERILDSQIYTMSDRTQLKEFTPSTKEIYRLYDSPKSIFDGLEKTLQSLWSKYDASIVECERSLESNYKDSNDKLNTARKKLSSDHEKILYCLHKLGFWCAYEAASIFVENSHNMTEDSTLQTESSAVWKSFLNCALSAIKDFLPQGSSTLKANKNYVSPKLHELLQIFQLLSEDSHAVCLIFVERIITAKVIERFLSKMTNSSHFTVSYLTGSNSSVDALKPKLQKQTLDSFCGGKINLLFATDVVEEGIHVPTCSCVIWFDLPTSVQSYTQSRRRARQNGSMFIKMLERNNYKQRDQLFNIIRSEHSVAETTMNCDPDCCILRAYNLRDTDTYSVEFTGASVTVDSSINLVHQYCDKLAGDKYNTLKPIFSFSSEGGYYECKLTLPPGAAFQTIIGPSSQNSHLAKQLVCLEACKRLYQMGALDNYLLPYIDRREESYSKEQDNTSNAGAGTTKRKELHGTIHSAALYGTWINNPRGAFFHAYRIDFSCNVASQLYSGFVLLTEVKLDDDVAEAKVDLYLLSNKLVKSSISSCGQLSLDADQIVRAMGFHELMFNGLFGKLFLGSKAQRKFLLSEDNKLFWNPAYLYLILPLESSSSSNPELRINWKGIDSCMSVIEFMKKSAWLSVENSQGNTRNLTPFGTTDVIYLANSSSTVEDLKDALVLAIHTGRIYTVSEVLVDSSADSPFDGFPRTDSPIPHKNLIYHSFSEYFHKKYGIVLDRPGQPLLLLKQSHCAYNLLVDFTAGDSSKVFSEKPKSYVRMPPELLVHIDLPMSVLKACYLIPSLMHRLETLMLASQLREEIAYNLPNVYIPSSLILEALTTLRCCEKFSMERLELLGDSVLKYAVSCHLFLNYPEKHEGQLSAMRCSEICNAALHKRGTDRKLQGYIRDYSFEPRRWTAPGQLSGLPAPCTHDVDTIEVPLLSKFQKCNEKLRVGRPCDKGHRWIGSKVIADCVEALIGAYYLAGGLPSALHVMKWLGIEVEMQQFCLDMAITRASSLPYIPKADEIKALEAKIQYVFSCKGFILEAITHASEQESPVGFCYQRLEFLGDSVLDLLITRHLYLSHSDIDAGELTDLRSASVTNENFAQIAVRRNLYQHLQHGSALLLSQTANYVKMLSGDEESGKSLPGRKGPKALGDLVESIAGAILIDTRLNLEEVWRVFEPLLSPIVTPDNLELPPLRKLNELCDSLGYFIKENLINDTGRVHVELSLQLKDELIIGNGVDRTKKAAKGQAAFKLLMTLQSKGIIYTCTASKRRKQDVVTGSESEAAIFSVISNDNGIKEDCSLTSSKKKRKTSHSPVLGCKQKSEIAVIGPLNMEKGGPRTHMYDLCKRMQWPMPTYQSTENKSKQLIQLENGSGKKQLLQLFVSSILLHIPYLGAIEITGEPRADKKSSHDSAAHLLLLELEKRGILVIASS